MHKDWKKCDIFNINVFFYNLIENKYLQKDRTHGNGFVEILMAVPWDTV